MQLTVNSVEEMLGIGQQLTKYLNKSTVIALYGSLGSGKTVLAKGIAAALGIEEELLSPTFSIILDYYSPKLQCRVNHMDLYRLDSDDDFYNIGGPDLLHSASISIIEWAERIADLLPSRNCIHISICPLKDYRIVNIKGLEDCNYEYT